MKIFIALILTILTLNAKIVVVTNKNSSIPSLSKEIVEYLYLAKIDSYNNTKISPIVSASNDLHDSFCNHILDKTVYQYDSYWSRLVFSGKKPLPKKYDFEEIKAKLKELNTIAYIDKKDVNDEWRIVYEEN